MQKHALELGELYGMKDTRTQLVKVCLQLQRRPRTAWTLLRALAASGGG